MKFINKPLEWLLREEIEIVPKKPEFKGVYNFQEGEEEIMVIYPNLRRVVYGVTLMAGIRYIFNI